MEPTLYPMAGGSDHRHEVICIEAKQVCDFCFQEERIERIFNDLALPADVDQNRLVVECEIDQENIRCREVNQRRDIREHNCKEGDRVLVCLAVEVPVIIRVVDRLDPTNVVATQERTVVFLKQAVLCAPDPTNIQCDVTGECCCFVVADPNQNQNGNGNGTPVPPFVTCVFNFCVVISSVLTVRVLVPTLGACQPRRCAVSAFGCPPVLPRNACENCNGDDDDNNN